MTKPHRARSAETKGKRDRPNAPADGSWSAQVMRTSNALDLEAGVFALANPSAVARSLKRSALASTRRKSEPFRSAMSMLTFYVNRAGSSLSAERRTVLEQAKVELRREFGRAHAIN